MRRGRAPGRSHAGFARSRAASSVAPADGPEHAPRRAAHVAGSLENRVLETHLRLIWSLRTCYDTKWLLGPNGSIGSFPPAPDRIPAHAPHPTHPAAFPRVRPHVTLATRRCNPSLRSVVPTEFGRVEWHPARSSVATRIDTRDAPRIGRGDTPPRLRSIGGHERSDVRARRRRIRRSTDARLSRAADHP
jgi:hypothetical protein